MHNYLCIHNFLTPSPSDLKGELITQVYLLVNELRCNIDINPIEQDWNDAN